MQEKRGKKSSKKKVITISGISILFIMGIGVLYWYLGDDIINKNNTEVSTELSKIRKIQTIEETTVETTEDTEPVESSSGLTPEDELYVGTEIENYVEPDYSWLTLVFENEKIVISDEFLQALYGFEFFQGATRKQIEKYFNDDYEFFSSAKPDDVYYLLSGEIDFGGTLVERLGTTSSGSQGTTQQSSGNTQTTGGESGDSGSLEDLKDNPAFAGGDIQDTTGGPASNGTLPDGMVIVGH